MTYVGRCRRLPSGSVCPLEADVSLPCMRCAYHCNSGERAGLPFAGHLRDPVRLAPPAPRANYFSQLAPGAPSALPLSASRSLRVSRRVEVLQRGASRELSLLITSAPGPAPSRRRLCYRHSEAAGDGLR